MNQDECEFWKAVFLAAFDMDSVSVKVAAEMATEALQEYREARKG